MKLILSCVSREVLPACSMGVIFRLNSKLIKRELTVHSYEDRSPRGCYLSLTFEIISSRVENYHEITRECREMPFGFIALCLKPPNLKMKMTTTSKLEVFMAECILYK